MYGLKNINMGDAWELSTGEDIIVAVLDSGIYMHSDIANQMWSNPGEVGGEEGVDDDGNGYIDDFYGWDFYYDDNTSEDTLGHGTHVAGTLAAEANNNEGITGVAYGSKVMALRVAEEGTSFASNSDIAAAVRYAADMGAKVLNCSFMLLYSSILTSAFEYAYDKGCIVVGATGNIGSSINLYPAKMDHAVAAGAVDHDDVRPSWSNYGSELDVVAPGVDVLSLRAPGTGESEDVVPPKTRMPNI